MMRKKKGSALVMVIAVTSLLLVLSVVILSVVKSSYINNISYEKSIDYRNAAESGIDKSLAILAKKGELPSERKYSYKEGRVINDVIVSNNYQGDSSKILIESKAYSKNIPGGKSKTIKVILSKTSSGGSSLNIFDNPINIVGDIYDPNSVFKISNGGLEIFGGSYVQVHTINIAGTTVKVSPGGSKNSIEANYLTNEFIMNSGNFNVGESYISSVGNVNIGQGANLSGKSLYLQVKPEGLYKQGSDTSNLQKYEVGPDTKVDIPDWTKKPTVLDSDLKSYEPLEFSPIDFGKTLPSVGGEVESKEIKNANNEFNKSPLEIEYKKISEDKYVAVTMIKSDVDKNLSFKDIADAMEEKSQSTMKIILVDGEYKIPWLYNSASNVNNCIIYSNGKVIIPNNGKNDFSKFSVVAPSLEIQGHFIIEAINLETSKEYISTIESVLGYFTSGEFSGNGDSGNDGDTSYIIEEYID